MNEKMFITSLKEININISEENLKSFSEYKDLLKEYNKKFNLTSIIDDESIYLKHFYDSLYLLTLNEVQKAKSILDIGTGAGFPGIPLAIMLPSAKITLVESNTKKCGFLELIKDKLKLDNVEVINERAENYTKNNREKYDIVTSRAVSSLKVLSELEIPALKVNGYFVPLKSNIEDELKDAEEILKNLDCTIENIISYTLPIENSKRTIPKIKKLKVTNKKYPREYNKIIKGR